MDTGVNPRRTYDSSRHQEQARLTRLMILELHERYSPGCRAVLDAVLSRNPMDESSQGEKVILRRRDGGS